MLYQMPHTQGALYAFKRHYDNFIGGAWVAPVNGEYFENISPINGSRL